MLDCVIILIGTSENPEPQNSVYQHLLYSGECVRAIPHQKKKNTVRSWFCYPGHRSRAESASGENKIYPSLQQPGASGTDRGRRSCETFPLPLCRDCLWRPCWSSSFLLLSNRPRPSGTPGVQDQVAGSSPKHLHKATPTSGPSRLTHTCELALGRFSSLVSPRIGSAQQQPSTLLNFQPSRRLLVVRGGREEVDSLLGLGTGALLPALES